MRWGVLGGGSRIYAKSLAPAFAAAGHEVVALARRDGASFAPYDELLRQDDVESVYIPLPNDMHAEWIHRALDAGKHVLCEKPLTLSPQHTAEVFDHAEAAGRVLLEAYMWPHHPRARRLLELASGGQLGTLQSGTARFSWPMNLASGDHRLDQRGAGALFDVGIYCLAPFLLAARREPVTCAATAVRNIDGVDVTMRAGDGSTRTIRCAYLVGCDGGASAVRSALGIKLRGEADLLDQIVRLGQGAGHAAARHLQADLDHRLFERIA